MQINAGEISSIIRQQIENFDLKTEVQEVGEVIQVADGIVKIFGLENVVLGELLDFSNGVKGLALNLEEDNVGAVLFSGETSVRQGDIVKRTNMVAEVPVGKGLLGRIVNPLGEPLDGKGPVDYEKLSPIERKATGVLTRKSVDQPLETGIKAIDGLIPVGRGQRELIVGDKKTGKTAICIDAIINQKGNDVFCIYVAIGQKASTIANIAARLEEEGAMEYTVIVASTSNDMAPLQFLAPYSGAAIGEYFRDNGMHAMIVYDDLTKHAWSYRQMSLLLKRPPGREAYPGDIFYLHSRLLERAAKLSDELGGGSLTAFPVIETQAGDISAFIPTNVISITDGQLFLEANLFNAGVRPAIDVGYSVSRVGGAAQKKAMKKVVGSLKLYLAQYREVESFAKFGSDLDKATQQQLRRGERLIEILKQPQYSPLPGEEQIISFFASVNGFLDEVDVPDVRKYEEELLETMRLTHDDLLKEIRDSDSFTDDIQARIKEIISSFTDGFISRMEGARESASKSTGKKVAKGFKTEKKMPDLKNMNLDEKKEIREEEEDQKL